MTRDKPRLGLRAQWTVGSVIWVVCLTGMALFQAWRGSYADALIFAGLVAVLTLDRTLGERLPRLGLRWRQAARLTSALLLVAGVVLVLVPRHGAIAWAVMVSLGLGMLVAAWPSVTVHTEHLTAVVRRTAWIWGSLAGAFVLWEGLTFVLSVTTPGGSDAHPTISVLLDPWLNSVLGKALFVAAWIGSGLGLLAVWRKP